MERCTDNRFELIEKYKQKLIEATNIETSKEEMSVIDNILFRFWQMGWLDKLEADVVPRAEVEKWYAEYHKVKEALKQEKMYHEATEKLADRYLIELKQAKQEVAEQIFEEIEKHILKETTKNRTIINDGVNRCFSDYLEGQLVMLNKIPVWITELKKKYIGE